MPHVAEITLIGCDEVMVAFIATNINGGRRHVRLILRFFTLQLLLHVKLPQLILLFLTAVGRISWNEVAYDVLCSAAFLPISFCIHKEVGGPQGHLLAHYAIGFIL